YVSSSEVDALVGQGWKEPRLALDGGPDGLVLVGRLITQAFPLLADDGFFLVETDPFQVPSVCDMLVRAGFGDICVWQDLSGHERVSGGRHP
ncbi:MAG: peptide chain release factor N(5)-glutamine methyltransferase, partial [Spirochaetaceae bacterium]|nr:peptide chain release factor N(5)-glutamine methyltransferase [Spirochaetaceae bacterium]